MGKQIKKFVKLQKVKKKMAVTPANSQKKENKENNGENQNKNNELDIGASITAKRADGSWHSANVVHRRTNPDTQETEYYVHYEGFNRRLDEWIKSFLDMIDFVVFSFLISCDFPIISSIRKS